MAFQISCNPHYTAASSDFGRHPQEHALLVYMGGPSPPRRIQWSLRLYTKGRSFPPLSSNLKAFPAWYCSDSSIKACVAKAASRRSRIGSCQKRVAAGRHLFHHMPRSIVDSNHHDGRAYDKASTMTSMVAEMMFLLGPCKQTLEATSLYRCLHCSKHLHGRSFFCKREDSFTSSCLVP